MGSKWRKVKLGLGLNTCFYEPRTLGDSSSPATEAGGRFSGAGLPSPTASGRSDSLVEMPTRSFSGHRLPNHSTKSSKKTCSICLTTMKRGQGHAIFTAECSHSFHFHCITANVKHGNQICPVCRAKWKDVPFQSAAPDLSHGRERVNHVSWPRDDTWMTILQRIPPINQRTPELLHAPEPGVFDDDEFIGHQLENTETILASCDFADDHSIKALDVEVHPEVSAVSKFVSHCDFAVLIHLKAPLTSARQHCGMSQLNLPSISQNSRAPVDLVTVLDVSSSMAGMKLALLKRAMGFVIQNLGPSDRLSVVDFSSAAHRLFPLRRMTDSGKQEALRSVNSLFSNGGTNIIEGLKKGAKVMTDRRWKNPVGSIILLSDGQDTYMIGPSSRAGYQSLLPPCIRRNSGANHHIPVHAFGFGADHDAASMHSISETSGGTFSFIEAENVIQDAFAQCIGGLLSVVVQELRVEVECIHQKLRLNSIKAGSYKTCILSDGRAGSIEVGDLYAEEERDFLVMMNIPVDNSSNEMSLLKVKCVYRDPITKELLSWEQASDVRIQRPEVSGQLTVSMEVDRQRNRLQAAEAMANARAAAECGNLAAAVSALEHCRKHLSETASLLAGDRLCVALDAELKEMQERMADRQVYESSGRAYVLSGLSSHSWQRATARGGSSDNASLMRAYQTPSMLNMVSLSQTMNFGRPSPQPSLRSARSFPGRP